MKRLFLTGFILLIVAFTIQAQSSQSVKIDLTDQQKTLDGLWDFTPATKSYEPVDASPKAIDEKAVQINNGLSNQNSNWFSIKTPQFLNRISWWLPNVSLAYEEQEKQRVKNFPFDTEKLQAGWYQKTIELPQNYNATATEIYANFEGVATISRVYANGQYVGGHLGMFGSFKCRLSPYLKAGKNNLLVYVERGVIAEKGNEVVSIAVTVPVTRDMLASLNSGMFGGFGNGPRAKFMGIWQPVKLEISHLGGKIDDVFFNPTLTGHELKIEMSNPTSKKIAGKLRYTISNKKTGEVLVAEADQQIIRLSENSNNQSSMVKKGLKPLLWTPDEPNLYELKVEWKDTKGKLIDSYQCQVGYRTVTTIGKNIFLNGKPYWLRGANMPPYGYKPNDEETAKAFLQLMHDGNTVITRTHGNPWNEMWYNAADEIGIGVSSEGVRPWALMTKAPAPKEALLAHWKQEQLESIKRYRNHPSVLFYCISNEGLQGDYENPAKLAIFKDLISSIKAMDDSRPVFQTSGDPDLSKQGDIEDVHSYWGWYDSSSFVNDYTQNKRGLNATDGMPFVNQECAVPYSMIDNGAVHPAYVGRYAAQSWIGDIGVYGKDVSYFQDHIYQEGKLKAEKLRYSRKYVNNSGFMLFSNVTWIQNALSKPSAEWKPFPVYEGVKEGFQPVLVALKSSQRNFFGGDTLKTEAFIVNDDAQFKDLKQTSLTIQFVDKNQKIIAEQSTDCGVINYFDIKEYPVFIPIPNVQSDVEELEIKLLLKNADSEIVSVNTYKIKIYQAPEKNEVASKTIISLGNNEAVNEALAKSGTVYTSLNNNVTADVIIIGPASFKVDSNNMFSHLKKGGRLILLQQQGKGHPFYQQELIPDMGAVGDKMENNNSYMFTTSDIFKNSLEKSKGEFVEMLGWENNATIFKNLKAMDWKWWAMKDSTAAYVSSASHKINIKNPNVIPLGRYLNSHFYWKGDLKKVYESTISYPVFAIKKDYGQLVVCELNITESVATDPRAEITLRNLVNEAIEIKAKIN